jgi:hypothetical protein
MFWLFLSVPLAEALPPRDPSKKEDAFAELDGEFTLRLFDAVNGKPLSQASVTFAGVEHRTNREGAVRFDLPPDLSAGEDRRKATVKVAGYVPSTIDIDFMAGSLWFNRYSISPALSFGQLRFVLDWNAKPADLDAHLLKKDDYHISYREKSNHEDLAWLDRDDRDGNGPETITLNRVSDDGLYRFFIHDYENRDKSDGMALSESRAQVRVYSSSELVYQFSVPPNMPGTIWEVFVIENGTLRVVDRME